MIAMDEQAGITATPLALVQWEYKTVMVEVHGDETLDEVLNRWGRAGWEGFGYATSLQGGSRPFGHTVIMKRAITFNGTPLKPGQVLDGNGVRQGKRR